MNTPESTSELKNFPAKTQRAVSTILFCYGTEKSSRLMNILKSDKNYNIIFIKN